MARGNRNGASNSCDRDSNRGYSNGASTFCDSDSISSMKDTLEKIWNRLEDDRRTAEKAREDDRKFYQQTIAELKNVVQCQQKEIQDLKFKVVKLEDRIDDLEQYSRKEDIIITGLPIHRSVADVVKGESVDSLDSEGRNSVEVQVLAKLSRHGVSIGEDEVSACHTLGRRQEDGTQKIIVRFVSRKSKVNVMRNAKKLKGTGIFINEHLTKKTGGLAKAARDLKKNGKIASTWTRDCKVFVKDNRGQVLQIRDLAKLSEF